MASNNLTPLERAFTGSFLVYSDYMQQKFDFKRGTKTVESLRSIHDQAKAKSLKHFDDSVKLLPSDSVEVYRCRLELNIAEQYLRRKTYLEETSNLRGLLEIPGTDTNSAVKTQNERLSEEVRQLRQQLEAKRMELEDVKTQNERLSEEVSQLHQELERKRVELEDVRTTADRNLEEVRQERDRLSTELEQLRPELEAKCEELASMAVTHRTQMESLKWNLTSLLNSRNAEIRVKTQELDRLRGDIEAFHRNPNDLLVRKEEEIRMIKTELVDKQRALEDLTSQLETLDRNTELRKALLEKKIQSEKAKRTVMQNVFEEYKQAVSRMMNRIQEFIEQICNPVMAPTLTVECAGILSQLEQEFREFTTEP